jgi:DnaJ-class molecular chaperone
MEIKMSDLQNKCEKCDGQGKVESPEMEKRNSGYCQDTHLIYATPVDCDACNGRGLVFTEAGKTLLDFLRLANSKYPKMF